MIDLDIKCMLSDEIFAMVLFLFGLIKDTSVANLSDLHGCRHTNADP